MRVKANVVSYGVQGLGVRVYKVRPKGRWNFGLEGLGCSF